MLQDYLTSIVCFKVEEVTIENHNNLNVTQLKQ